MQGQNLKIKGTTCTCGCYKLERAKFIFVKPKTLAYKIMCDSFGKVKHIAKAEMRVSGEEVVGSTSGSRYCVRVKALLPSAIEYVVVGKVQVPKERPRRETTRCKQASSSSSHDDVFTIKSLEMSLQ